MNPSKLAFWSFLVGLCLTYYTIPIYAQNKPNPSPEKAVSNNAPPPLPLKAKTPPPKKTTPTIMATPPTSVAGNTPKLVKKLPAQQQPASKDNATTKQTTAKSAKPQPIPSKNVVWEDRDTSLQLVKRIKGRISPKSVVHSGNGLFFAQNMMYNHTITVYNRNYALIKTINDAVNLSEYGYEDTEGTYRGAPVEVAFSHNGQYAWVSNYDMSGKGFEEELGDDCSMRKDYQQSFIYKINTTTYEIEQVIGVGSVPKYVAATPDNRYILVSNWCSGDLSIIDIQLGEEIRRVTLGSHPRGIVVNPDTQLAYVAIMGGSKIAVVDLNNFSLNWIPNVGVTPRHLCLSPDHKYLYVTLNNKHSIAKIDLNTQKVVAETYSGRAPRSMTISKDGQYLYVVNYNSNNISKIQANDMSVVQKIKTDPHPIGITLDPQQNDIWVACYSGSILVFKDRNFWYKGKPETPLPAGGSPAEELPEITLPIVQKSRGNKTLLADRNASKKVAAKNSSGSLFPKANASALATPAPRTAANGISKPKIIRPEQANFCVIGGSFDEQTMHKIKPTTALLQSLGFAPEIMIDGVLQKYRLSIGCFNNENEAQKLLSEARSLSITDAWILKQ